jgi:hypothetical protein
VQRPNFKWRSNFHHQPSEANMIVTNYTPDDLKKLPLRAIVALGARCARRVQHLAVPPHDHPDAPRLQAAVSDAIHLTEDVANGVPRSSAESVVKEVDSCRAVANCDFVQDIALATIENAARAAADALHALDLRKEGEASRRPGSAADPLLSLADVTADLTARSVFTAAFEAVAADGHTDAFIKAAIEDYEKLLRLDLGSYPDEGKPIDPTSKGPLGALGPRGLTR